MCLYILLYVYMVHVMYVHVWLCNEIWLKDVLGDGQYETLEKDATTQSSQTLMQNPVYYSRQLTSTEV